MSGASRTWVFLRHGESTANAARIVSGWDDVALTPQGERQARAAGAALAEVPLVHAVSSDLRRARDTARLALEARAAARSEALALSLEGRLRERNLGRWQGQPYPRLRDTGEMQTLLAWSGRPPGGESNADLAWRVVGALADLDARLTPGSALVVAHGGVIRAVLGLLDGTPRDDIAKEHIPNAVPLPREVASGRWEALLAALA